ncbi:hypothetical protein BJY04DRAFT_188193 [Aspergillus karnatakaensis]|uniref:uncharacterized protein n=1 Tax=Aspergillus karnatakaensis TaxID=1810916 RepID=UPI003CCD0E22
MNPRFEGRISISFTFGVGSFSAPAYPCCPLVSSRTLCRNDCILITLLHLLTRIALRLRRVEPRHIANIPTLLHPGCRRRHHPPYALYPRLPRLRVSRQCLFALPGGVKPVWPKEEVAEERPTKILGLVVVLHLVLQLSEFLLHPFVFLKDPEPRCRILDREIAGIMCHGLGASGDEAAEDAPELIVPHAIPFLAFELLRNRESGEGYAAFDLSSGSLSGVLQNEEA